MAPTPTAQRASGPPRRQSLTEVETEQALELDMGQGQKHLAIYELPFYGSTGPWRVKRKWRIVGAKRTASGLPPETATPPPTTPLRQGPKACMRVCVCVSVSVTSSRGQSATCALYFILHNWACNESNWVFMFWPKDWQTHQMQRVLPPCLSPTLSLCLSLLLSRAIYCFFRNRLSRMRTKRGDICSRWSFVWHAPRPHTQTHAYTEV